MSLMDTISQQLTNRHETIAVAESCTGGGLAYYISQVPGISNVFLGGMVTYANSAKINLLHIPKDTIATHGAVSKEIALLMAKNCKQAFGSTWALSTTGIAGPGGGSKEKPVGIVWIGIAGPTIHEAYQFVFENLSRLEHQRKTIEQALYVLEQNLKHLPQKIDGK